MQHVFYHKHGDSLFLGASALSTVSAAAYRRVFSRVWSETLQPHSTTQRRKMKKRREDCVVDANRAAFSFSLRLSWTWRLCGMQFP
jgi:hypothetical protein